MAEEAKKSEQKQAEYLTRACFFEYMGDFRENLEGRLSTLEAGMGNPLASASGSYKEKLILILIGAVLALAGVAAGATWL